MLRWHRQPKCPLSAPYLPPREAQWWSKMRDLAGCDRGTPRAPRFLKAVRRITLDKNPKQDQAPGASKMDFSAISLLSGQKRAARLAGRGFDVRTCLFGVFADHDPACSWLQQLALGVAGSCCKLLLLLCRLLSQGGEGLKPQYAAWRALHQISPHVTTPSMPRVRPKQ